MAWILVAFLAPMLTVAVLLLVRASRRMLDFDELFQQILTPMQEYSAELKKISTAEGLLHDHPEVLAFHRANMRMLQKMDAAIKIIQEAKPQKKKEKLPRPEAE
jgi:cell fate (sporulation/competence/biofilm development) regulator YlbF (YheA/YmcA/DUF963 family)